MASLAFDCGIQLSMPSFFCIENKINFVAMLVILLALLIYSLCFYNLVYRFYSFKFSGIILQRSHKKLFQSFCMEPLYLVFRVLLRSMIHGFFIENYKIQIFLLLATDLIFTYMVFKIRKIF